MKTSGMTRPVDSLGRIVIPMEIRENLDIKTKDLIDITVQGDKIILSKYSETCIFCGEDEDLVLVEGKKVCINCLRKLSKLA